MISALVCKELSDDSIGMLILGGFVYSYIESIVCILPYVDVC